MWIACGMSLVILAILHNGTLRQFILFSSEHSVRFPVDYRVSSAKQLTASYGKSRAHGFMRPFFVGD